MQRIFSVVLCLLLAACGGMNDDATAARVSVSDFRSYVSSGDHEAIYAMADPLYKNSVTPQQHERLFSVLKKRLGPFDTATETGWKVNYTTDGHFVVLAYNAKFHNGEGAEMFTWKVTDGKPALAGYNINSPALLAD
ncbi:DUF4019 domain-containing protein [Blastomonas sp.]|uniref:DUF4019 domain-containing protein n=1 Tax=Blastomonas sp. TaxID=1909299 RepID=UPI00262786A2|nr:DUF4019 domain-containing protein [Blastomonas sp.]MDM7956113.1 DUF4019 domain-containing protein [Blastomonas sp.]